MHNYDCIQRGQLVRDTTGQVGVIIEVLSEYIREPFRRNDRGITRCRVDYIVDVLMNDQIQQRPIYFRHNSYQMEHTYWTIDVKPEDVRTIDRYKLVVM